MPTPFGRILILTKARHEQAQELGCRIQQWLAGKETHSEIRPNDESEGLLHFGGNPPDMILVLGGDGTMLSVARRLGDHSIPLLGLNLGQVGFLTELSPEDWEEGLNRILAGHYLLSARIMLDYRLWRGKDVLGKGRVVNDLVVGRGGMARLVALRLWCGAADLGRMRADGLVVSTPQGATAYAVAAGGPLISPELKVVEICPVCPFLSHFRPLVLPSREHIEIEVDQASGDVYLTLDGQSGRELRIGDRISIAEAERPLLFIQPSESHYINKLKKKGYIS
jgi:NAD+ kinase